jgi:DNA-binding transcriptional LysR family regulator
LRILREEVMQRVPFDAASTQRAFNLCMTDVSEFTLVPALVRRLASMAPHSELRLQSLTVGELPAAMAAGNIDLAVGFFPELQDSLFQQQMFETGFTCIARRGNPFADGGLTLERFCTAPQVAMKVRSHQGIVQRDLRAAGIERRVKVTVQHFHSLSAILSQTDMLAVVPEDVAPHLARSFDAQIHELPYPSSRFEVRQYWHELYHRDLANRWMRGQVRELFQREGRRPHP